jgi:GPH family glycoside/pentoside/hexuronide:cation symporter
MAYAACVFVLAIAVVLIVRRFPITRHEHEARLALLDQAAKADPDAIGQHP